MGLPKSQLGKWLLVARRHPNEPSLCVLALPWPGNNFVEVFLRDPWTIPYTVLLANLKSSTFSAVVLPPL